MIGSFELLEGEVGIILKSKTELALSHRDIETRPHDEKNVVDMRPKSVAHGEWTLVYDENRGEKQEEM